MPSKLLRFPVGAYPRIPFEASASLSRLVRLLVELHPPAKNPAHGPVVIKEFLRYVLTDIRSIYFPKKNAYVCPDCFIFIEMLRKSDLKLQKV